MVLQRCAWHALPNTWKNKCGQNRPRPHPRRDDDDDDDIDHEHDNDPVDPGTVIAVVIMSLIILCVEAMLVMMLWNAVVPTIVGSCKGDDDGDTRKINKCGKIGFAPALGLKLLAEFATS